MGDGLIHSLRRMEFLARLFQVTGGSPTVRASAAYVASELGLCLSEALMLVEEFHKEGLVHRCDTPGSPRGPEIHLTLNGLIEAYAAAEWSALSRDRRVA